jgi:hypothetical protein
MPFTVPEFPLLCNIWAGPNPPTGVPRLTAACNLGMGRRIMPAAPSEDVFNAPHMLAQLLLPAGTDIRDASCSPATSGDVVEVPAGSGRFYYVLGVDDLGKGFPNEHRFALLAKACSAYYGPFAGVDWPTPIP